MELDAQAVALNLDSIEAGLNVLKLDLKLATLIAESGGSLFKFGHFGVELLEIHGVCLFDELSIGHGRGLGSPPVPLQALATPVTRMRYMCSGWRF